jgi:hypothetical protein
MIQWGEFREFVPQNLDYIVYRCDDGGRLVEK